MAALNPLRVYSRADLLGLLPERQLRRYLASGAIVRLRRDAYASPALPIDVQRAVTLGGSVACVSALAHVGGWLPPHAGVHVAVARNASRLARHRRLLGGARIHWTARAGRESVQEPEDAVAQVIRCQPRAVAIAVLDSVVRLGAVDRDVVRKLIDRAPRRCTLTWGDLDPRAESGIESLVRVALRDAGLTVEPQVVVAGVGRVDFLVEGRVIVEVDGREWHRGEQERDYRRDLEALSSGFPVVRVDYLHALRHGDLVVAAVRRALSARIDTARGVRLLRNS